MALMILGMKPFLLQTTFFVFHICESASKTIVGSIQDRRHPFLPQSTRTVDRSILLSVPTFLLVTLNKSPHLPSFEFCGGGGFASVSPPTQLMIPMQFSNVAERAAPSGQDGVHAPSVSQLGCAPFTNLKIRLDGAQVGTGGGVGGGGVPATHWAAPRLGMTRPLLHCTLETPLITSPEL